MFDYNDDRDFDTYAANANEAPEPLDHWALEDFDDLLPRTTGWE